MPKIAIGERLYSLIVTDKRDFFSHLRQESEFLGTRLPKGWVIFEE